MDEVAFGRFRLIELIGEGGMGKVYRAHDTVIGRDVAIKVLSVELGEQPGYRERFRREAHTAARVTEPHIIPIHDAGEHDGHLYLVMPLIDGVDVHRLLKRDGPMSPPRAVAVIEQLAAALSAAHQAGLVHRDVKPSNALVTGGDFVYLIDFGIAHDAAGTRLTNTGMMVGTLAYMAPERFTAGTADARADVYALACVLYECLTGVQPYPGDSFEQQIAGHLTLAPPKPTGHNPEIAAGLDEVIAMGMAKKPDQRYQSARELATAARRALTEVPAVNPRTAPTRIIDPLPRAAAKESIRQQPYDYIAATRPRPPVPLPPIATLPPRGQRPGLPLVAALIAAVAAIAVISAVIIGYRSQARSPAPQTTTAQPPAPAEPAEPTEPTAQPAPPATQTPQPAPSFAAVEQTACARLGSAHDSDGHRCAIATMRFSAVAPEWVFVQGLGYYTGSDEPPSFAELTGQGENMILDLSTQQTIGPTDTGWCPPETGDAPLRGYTAVPTAVLADFGLSPCAA